MIRYTEGVDNILERDVLPFGDYDGAIAIKDGKTLEVWVSRTLLAMIKNRKMSINPIELASEYTKILLDELEEEEHRIILFNSKDLETFISNNLPKIRTIKVIYRKIGQGNHRDNMDNINYDEPKKEAWCPNLKGYL